MGYYNYYNLDIKLDCEEYQKDLIIKDLLATNEEAASALLIDGRTRNQAYWYDSIEDMKAFSKKYHDVLFTLYRRGQEFQDVDKVFFKNGKYKFYSAMMSYYPIKTDELKNYHRVLINDDYIESILFIESMDNSEHKDVINIIKELKAYCDEAAQSLNEWGNLKKNINWPNYECDLINFTKIHRSWAFKIYRSIKDERRVSMNDLSPFGIQTFKNGKRSVSVCKWQYIKPSKWFS